MTTKENIFRTGLYIFLSFLSEYLLFVLSCVAKQQSLCERETTLVNNTTPLHSSLLYTRILKVSVCDLEEKESSPSEILSLDILACYRMQRQEIGGRAGLKIHPNHSKI